VVRNFNGDKASGLDGFSMAFFLEVLGGIKRGHYDSFQGVS
jgi:hypothetical protein